MYVLGIDGGGTKTTGVIADRYGHVYAKETVGATNQNGVEISTIEKELATLFQSLMKQNSEAFSNLKTVFAGMSGVDRPDAKEVIRTILVKLVPENVDIIIDNDGINALYSGTLGKPGIVQIAGTGSITFGVNDKGDRKRVGGWGYLIDDEGSGYDIGRAALHAIFKAYDGRGQQTLLSEMILQHFNVSETPELINFIYEAGKSRSAIAPLSRYVTDAADKGDIIAIQILNQTCSKLVASISILYHQLFENTQKLVPVIVVGGVFSRFELLEPFMKEFVQQAELNIEFLKPEIEPVGGAVAAALVHGGIKVEDDFLPNMKKK